MASPKHMTDKEAEEDGPKIPRPAKLPVGFRCISDKTDAHGSEPKPLSLDSICVFMRHKCQNDPTDEQQDKHHGKCRQNEPRSVAELGPHWLFSHVGCAAPPRCEIPSAKRSQPDLANHVSNR